MWVITKIKGKEGGIKKTLQVLYLVIGQLEPRLFPVRKNLPQNDSKAPDVTFCGELAVHDTFWRHPSDRQHGVTSNLKQYDRDEREVGL